MMDYIGMPPEVADYLRAGPRRAVDVRALQPYVLRATFDDGAVRDYDMREKLYGMLEPLKDWNVFRRVYLDDTNSIAWDAPTMHIDTSKDTVYIYGTPVE